MTRRIFQFTSILQVHDGDTVTCLIDQGFNNFKRQIIRLYGIDAAELKDGEKAIEAKKFLETFINKLVTLESIKPDKYGDRYLGIITLAGETKSLNDILIEMGLAKSYSGGKR